MVKSPGGGAPFGVAARAALLPAAGLYWIGSGVHRFVRSRQRRRLPLPAVSVGGLTVGGDGKTPLASWIAATLIESGRKPAVLMRGYRGDEQLVHRELVEGITVVCNPDRFAGARGAVELGADSLVLDDAYQHREIAPDLNVAVVAAEHLDGSRLLLPAGRWRERIAALGRADAVVVTCKTASETALATACELVGEVARSAPLVMRFEISAFTGLDDGAAVGADRLVGARVIATAGIANPQSFFGQLEALGMSLSPRPLPDHHSYSAASIRSLVRDASGSDFVVVTLKDAVKLRGRWPAGSPPVLVARQSLRWGVGGDEFARRVRTAVGGEACG